MSVASIVNALPVRLRAELTWYADMTVVLAVDGAEAAAFTLNLRRGVLEVLDGDRGGAHASLRFADKAALVDYLTGADLAGLEAASAPPLKATGTPPSGSTPTLTSRPTRPRSTSPATARSTSPVGSALAQLLPTAIGFALSPVALVEMVLVLFSRRARTNSLIFLAAIMIAVFVIPFIGASGADAATSSAASRSTTEAVVLLIVAALLAVLAWRNYRNRHDASVPAMLGKIDGMGPAAVLVLSAGVTFANPKNLVLLLGAGAVAAKQGLSTVELAATLAIFTDHRHLAVHRHGRLPAPRGRASQHRLQQCKEWLLRNNRLIMAAVLAALALALASQGIDRAMTQSARDHSPTAKRAGQLAGMTGRWSVVCRW